MRARLVKISAYRQRRSLASYNKSLVLAETLQRFVLKKADFLWLLAFPLYLLIGTLRHEASHALVGWLAEATSIQVS
jgi:hypothetical protein